MNYFNKAKKILQYCYYKTCIYAKKLLFAVSPSAYRFVFPPHAIVVYGDILDKLNSGYIDPLSLSILQIVNAQVNVNALRELLKNANNLEYLYLSRINVEGMNLNFVALPSLKTLDIIDTRISDNDLMALIVANAFNIKKIRITSLSNNVQTIGNLNFGNISFTSLKDLDLSHTSINIKTLFSWLSNAVNVINLDLTNCQSLKNAYDAHAISTLKPLNELKTVSLPVDCGAENVFRSIIKAAPSLLQTWSIFQRCVMSSFKDERQHLELCIKFVMETANKCTLGLLGVNASFDAIKKCILMQSNRAFTFEVLQALNSGKRLEMLSDPEILEHLTKPGSNNSCMKIRATHRGTQLPQDLTQLLFGMLGMSSVKLIDAVYKNDEEQAVNNAARNRLQIGA